MLEPPSWGMSDTGSHTMIRGGGLSRPMPRVSNPASSIKATAGAATHSRHEPMHGGSPSRASPSRNICKTTPTRINRISLPLSTFRFHEDLDALKGVRDRDGRVPFLQRIAMGDDAF